MTSRRSGGAIGRTGKKRGIGDEEDTGTCRVRRKPMNTRAAVAFEPKKRLEIVELDLEGPKVG